MGNETKSPRGGTAEAKHVPKRLLAAREAGKYLGRSEKSIRHLVERGKLRSIRADRQLMFDLADLDAWIDSNRT